MNEVTTQEATRFVRITSTRREGYVEFNFAIGDPSIYLEMILPVAAFHDFCAEQRAVFLTPEQERAVDAAEAKWRYGEPQEQD